MAHHYCYHPVDYLERIGFLLILVVGLVMLLVVLQVYQIMTSELGLLVKQLLMKVVYYYYYCYFLFQEFEEVVVLHPVQP